MNVHEVFKNVFTYAMSAEGWVKGYFNEVGFEPEYTFSNDFAIADWLSKEAVIETYGRVKSSWIDDYKAFTEVVMHINLMSRFHDMLRNKGFDGRDEFVELYFDLYYQARNDFYTKYKGNDEAYDYFYKTTD